MPLKSLTNIKTLAQEIRKPGANAELIQDCAEHILKESEHAIANCQAVIADVQKFLDQTSAVLARGATPGDINPVDMSRRQR